MPFPERLRELRKKAGLSQRDLAERVGIDFTYLSKIENGIVGPPRELVIRKLAHELAVTLKIEDETGLTDELITEAGKIPSDLARTLAQNPSALAYLRSLPTDVKSGDDWTNVTKRPGRKSRTKE